MNHRQRNLSGADETWVQRYRPVVERAFEFYLNEQSWPEVEGLQRSLDQDGLNIDVVEAVSAIPRLPGELRQFQPVVVAPPLRMLQFLPLAGPLLAACLAIVRYAVSLYFTPGGTSAIRSDDQAVVEEIPDPTVRIRAGVLVSSDYPSPLAGGSYGTDSWSLEINGQMARRFRGVDSVEAYFERQAEILGERAVQLEGVEQPRQYTAFVLMPFQTRWSIGVYEMIQRAVEQVRQHFDLIAYRADEISRPGKITDQIVESIDSAHLIIADITGNNANVMYELGRAHHAGVPVIILNQSVAKSPFDLRDWRQVVYGGVPTSGDEQKLVRHLLDALRAVAVT